MTLRRSPTIVLFFAALLVPSTAGAIRTMEHAVFKAFSLRMVA
jgi:hypothetical protein